MNMHKVLEDLFDALAKRGITLVRIKFSGGGDEGGCDAVVLRDASGIDKQIDPYTSRDGLIEALSELPNWLYGGFEVDGVIGELVVDVVGRRVTGNGQERDWTDVAWNLRFDEPLDDDFLGAFQSQLAIAALSDVEDAHGF